MKNWQRNKEQYLSNLYAHMRERVSNPEKSVSGRHYLGLPICSKVEFMRFGMNDKEFSKLFSKYKRSKGKRKIAPSIDRINNNKGYTLRNIQFLPLRVNSVKEHLKKWIILQDTITKKFHRFETTTEARAFLNHSRRPKMSHAKFVNTVTGRVYMNLTGKIVNG